MIFSDNLICQKKKPMNLSSSHNIHELFTQLSVSQPQSHSQKEYIRWIWEARKMQVLIEKNLSFQTLIILYMKGINLQKLPLFGNSKYNENMDGIFDNYKIFLNFDNGN